MTQHILFDAAGLNLAVEANYVRAVHESLPVQPVAGTRHWFLGLGVVNGKLLPVTDVGAFAGRQGCTGFTLEVVANTSVVGLKIDALRGASDRKMGNREGLPVNNKPVLPQILLSGHLFFSGDTAHHEVDVAALIDSPAFVNISI